jgi:hypothetical protein
VDRHTVTRKLSVSLCVSCATSKTRNWNAVSIVQGCPNRYRQEVGRWWRSDVPRSSIPETGRRFYAISTPINTIGLWIMTVPLRRGFRYKNFTRNGSALNQCQSHLCRGVNPKISDDSEQVISKNYVLVTLRLLNSHFGSRGGKFSFRMGFHRAEYYYRQNALSQRYMVHGQDAKWSTPKR